MNLGERLKIAREAIGYSQSHVAEKVGLKGASAICELETGKREPKFSQLSKLAEIYHKPVEFFFSDTPLTKPVFLWRISPEDENQRKQVEAEFLELCEQYHNLEILTGELRPVELPTLIMEDKNVEEFNFRDAERLAIRTRKELFLGDIPADVLRRILEEKYYVKIFHLSFSGSAISIRREEIGSAILLNNNESSKNWRRNYDLAHELFHLLTWDVFRKNSSQCEPSPNEEKLANAFASHLLLPEEAVKEKVESYSDSQERISFDSLDNISREFGVSTEALLWRIHYIYKKGEPETKKNIDIAKRHKKLRPSENPEELPERYCALAQRALLQGNLSLLQFKKYMRISYKEAEKYLVEAEFTDEEISISVT